METSFATQIIDEVVDEIIAITPETTEAIACDELVENDKRSVTPIDDETDLTVRLEALEKAGETEAAQQKQESVSPAKVKLSLASKGYSTKIVGSTRLVINLLLMANASTSFEHHVKAEGFPMKMAESELFLLFEECGQIFSMRISEWNSVFVTYTKEEDADRAINLFNCRTIDGHKIVARRTLDRDRIIVRGISTSATKDQLFHRFSRLTNDLQSVEVYNDPVFENKIRNFCYLNYGSYERARNAMQKLSSFLSYSTVEWPNRHLEWATKRDTLYINNLRSNVRGKDLKDLFSVYGEIASTEMTGNFGKVRFRCVEDADRAARQIDRSQLGNENVLIRFNDLSKKVISTSLPQREAKAASAGSFQPISCDTRDRSSRSLLVQKSLQSIADTLYLKSLRSTVTAIDLRKCFSVYGEVMSVDKDGNSASIQFRKPENAKRAAQGIDKRQLGDNVQISFFEQRQTSDTLYIYKMFPNMTTKQLRTIFSAHGEVMDVDINGDFAAVGFRSTDDSKRAMQCVDRIALGKANVEILFFAK